MRLDADGKKRLEAMKKALAAGLPLVGLLVGMSAMEAGAVPGGMLGAPLSLPEERRVEPPVRKPVEKLAEQPAPAERDATGTDASLQWTTPGDLPCPDEPPPPPAVP